MSEYKDWLQDRYVTLILQLISAIIIFIGLYLISINNYLLFHGIVELIGIAIAFSIFILVWNTRRLLPDAFFLIIGISLLFTGSLDLLHTLAFKGMGVFAGNNADLPTQLLDCRTLFPEHSHLYCNVFHWQINYKRQEI